MNDYRSIADRIFGRPSPPTDLGFLSHLERIVELAGSEHHLDELPEVVLSRAIDLFMPDIACLYTSRPATSEFIATAKYPETFWQQPEVQARFGHWAQGAGSIGEAISAGRVIFVADVQAKAASGNHVAYSRDDGSELVIPVSAHDHLSLTERPVACLVLTRRRGNPFIEAHVAAARMVQVALAAVFNRAVARDRRERRLDFLKSLGQVLDARNVESVLTSFLESLVRLADARVTILWLRNGLPHTSDVLVARAICPAELDGIPVTVDSLEAPVMPRANCLTGGVLDSKKPTIFKNVQNSPTGNPQFIQRHNLEWFVAFPITDESGEVQAVLNVWPHGEPQQMDEMAIQTLESYISPFRTLLRLMDLLREEQELDTHVYILDAVLKDRRGPGPSWDNLAHGIRDMISCEHCSIFLFEKGSQTLRLQGTTGLEGLDSQFSRRDVAYQPSHGMTGEVFRRNEPYIYYAGIRDEISKKHLSKYREPTEGRSRSILFAPIQEQATGDAIGVVRCTNKIEGTRVGYFTKPDSTQLVRFSKALSMSMFHATWLRDREREWEYILYGLHHELLAPVDTFTIQSSWLLRHLSLPVADRDDDGMKKKAIDLRNNAVLADAVVHGLGRLEETLRLNEEPCAVSNIVLSSIVALRPTAAREKVDIRIDYFGVSRVRVDRVQIMRVMFNLARNSLKYFDWNRNDRYIRFSARETDKAVIVSVEDNGIGVPVADSEKIFEKFGRGDNAEDAFPQGTGLGLYYCRKILLAHSGGALVLARNGAPTVFEVWLPKE